MFAPQSVPASRHLQRNSCRSRRSRRARFSIRWPIGCSGPAVARLGKPGQPFDFAVTTRPEPYKNVLPAVCPTAGRNWALFEVRSGHRRQERSHARCWIHVDFSGESLERAMGFEPTTPTLARLCSTPELHPHPKRVRRSSALLAGAALKLCQRAHSFATAPIRHYQVADARHAG
jgi:hypothetical protein